MEEQSTLHIRDARDGDRDAHLAVTLSAYEEYSAVIPPPYWEEYRLSIIDTLKEERPVERIVAEQDGAIVGSVLLYPAGTTFDFPDGSHATLQWPEIRLLAVAPAARGRGVGVALVEECIRRARQAGAAKITLHTADIMQTAMRMYERMGFVRAPELDFKPAEDEEVIIKGYSYNLG